LTQSVLEKKSMFSTCIEYLDDSTKPTADFSFHVANN